VTAKAGNADAEGSVRLTEDMLPAIRACVVRRQVLLSAATLLILGGLPLAAFSARRTDRHNAEPPSEGADLYIYAEVAVGAAMVSVALVGIVRRHPRSILHHGVLLLAVGAVFLIVGLIDLVTSLMGEGRISGPAVIIYGGASMWSGIRLIRRYGQLASWLSEAGNVSAEERKRMQELFGAFVRSGEDYFSGRVRADVVEKPIFIHRSGRRPYWGQLLENNAILIAKTMSNCLFIRRQDAREGYFASRGRVRVKTDQGEKRMTVRTLSVLTLKRWADIPIVKEDIRLAVKRKKATPALLRHFLSDPAAELRLAALEGLKSLGNKEDTSAAAMECLDDFDAGIRAAAMAVCTRHRLAGLEGRAAQLLTDPDSPVRAAAADYLAAFPAVVNAAALQKAIQAERDSKALARMTRAMKAVEKAGANPYAPS